MPKIDERFSFGRNWTRFLEVLDDDRIDIAEASLREMLGVDDLVGRRFLDAGSGSGLFSLAARRLGARVHSFDYDADSVACTQELRRRFFADDPDWTVESGSVLDADYLEQLGTFDVVYSWGVMHHTGDMATAMDLIHQRLSEDGQLFIMLYEDRGFASRVWHFIKRTYNRGTLGRWAVTAVMIPYYVLRGLLEDLVRLRNPMARYREYRQKRGMSKYHDWIDWIGGYPFEVISHADVVAFYGARGFKLERSKTQEYVLRRQSSA